LSDFTSGEYDAGMSMRMIELFLPESVEAHVKEVFKELPVLNVWYERFNDQRLMVKVLADTGHVQTILDAIDRFSAEDGYRAIVLKVEAAIPRPDSEDPPEPSAEEPTKPTILKRRSISREELYTEVSKGVSPSATFVWMVILSALVACIGLIKDSAAVVIGAMVIAPLLGPNVGLALSTTLADGKLALQALRANAVGIAIAFVISVTIGFSYQFFNLEPPLNTLSEVVARTRVDFWDVALALISGMAGALSLTTGLSATLIGVMVAVALLPPLATFSMFLGAGQLELALSALLLLAVNVICVNLAGVATFLLQGIQPATWWEAKRAKRATVFALTSWVILLAGLLVLLSLSN
jgi:uncharacterized hydrophobic protein (TIGR00341 family)